jgi:hypothetical protein
MTAAIPAVTTDQMREVDRIAGEVSWKTQTSSAG